MASPLEREKQAFYRHSPPTSNPPGSIPGMACRQIPPGLCSLEALVKGAELCYSEKGTCCLALTELKGRGGSWLQCLVHTLLCTSQARGTT